MKSFDATKKVRFRTTSSSSGSYAHVQRKRGQKHKKMYLNR